jgi:hypothetical protein
MTGLRGENHKFVSDPGTLMGRGMSDEKLYGLCKKYSKFIRYGRQKFIGLLPEVFKSRMYERKGFGSIYEFAGKLAYMSREQVDLVLNLNRRFEDKPALQSLLLNGGASVNKLARVVSVATPENQEVLAEQVKILPQKALETLVRDEKLAKTEDVEGLQQPLIDDKSLRAQALLSKLKIDADLVEKIYELQKKNIDINEMLRKMLAAREAGISAEKNVVGEEALVKAEERSACDESRVAVGGGAARVRKKSRYISVRVRKILKEEYGDKCLMHACGKSARQIHHAQRFALAGVHDPRYMAPLCEEHHRIAHSIDQKTQENWRDSG